LTKKKGGVVGGVTQARYLGGAIRSHETATDA
jgi:hypothetical protein